MAFTDEPDTGGARSRFGEGDELVRPAGKAPAETGGAPRSRFGDDRLVSAGRRERAGPGETALFGAQGVTGGVLDVLGAPVDLAAASLRSVAESAQQPATFLPFQGGRFNPVEALSDVVGITDPVDSSRLPPAPQFEQPLGGSASLRDLGAQAGVTFRDIEDLPPEVRPVARAGEIFGSAMPFAAAPLGIAARTTLAGQQAAGPIIRAAQQAPARFAAAEASGAAGAALGGGAAEAIAPGNVPLGVTMEIGGGLVSPFRLLSQQFTDANSAISRLGSLISERGRQRAAGQVARQQLEIAGEDVEGVISRLQAQNNVANLPETAAMRADSPTLLGLERALVKKNPGLDNNMRRRLNQVSTQLDSLVRDAVESGDPQLIREAAQSRDRWFSALLQSRIQEASQRAAQAAQRISPDLSRGAAGVEAREILQNALTDARAGERALWEAIDPAIVITPDNAIDAFTRVRIELIDEEAIPAPIQAFMQRAEDSARLADEAAEAIRTGAENADELLEAAEAAQITSGEILRTRSLALRLERLARSGNNPRFDIANFLHQVSDGMLDDLAVVPGSDEARGFSRQLNDLFRRGEVGRLLRYDVRGGAAVPPELTLETGLRGGGTRGAVASRQIEAAAQLQGLPGDLSRRSTLELQQQELRNRILRTIDPETGRVRPQALDAFRVQNEELLRQFPGLDDLTRDAATASRLLRQTQQVAQKAQRAVQNKAAFARAAQMEDPARAVGSVLTGSTPSRSYNELARLAQRGGEPTRDGLRAATFEYLFETAARDGTVSGSDLKRMLTESVTGRPSVLQIMQTRQIISPDQRKNLMRVVDEMERIEDLISTGQRVEIPETAVNALEDLVTRLVGANVGASSPIAQATGSSLVTAAATSRFFSMVTQKLPGRRVAKILADAVEDPKLMASILSKSRAGQRDLTRQIHAYLWSAMLQNEQAQEREAQTQQAPLSPAMQLQQRLDDPRTAEELRNER